MFFRHNVMSADLCIFSFNGFSKLFPTIYFFHKYYEMIQETQSVFKSHGI